MPAPRYYNLGTVDDYAKVHGISVRTARKRMASEKGALKTGKGWRVPILSTQFAKARGISAKVARKSATRTVDRNSLLFKAQAVGPMGSSRTVPWKQSDGRNMFASGRLARGQYQYQGSAIVRFKSSGDVVEVFTHIILTPTPATYQQLDGMIRKSIAKQLGTSPVEILATRVIHAKSQHTWKA